MYHADVARSLDALPAGLHPADAWLRTKQAMTAAARTMLRAAPPNQSVQHRASLRPCSCHERSHEETATWPASPSDPCHNSPMPSRSRAIATSRSSTLSSATAIVRAAHVAPTDLRDTRQSPFGGGTATTRHRAQQQWAQFWLPFGRRSAIAGVLLPGKTSR